jgi:hypothetical protein
MQTSIPPLKLIPLDLLLLPRPEKAEPWEKLSRPDYWFGDRLLTAKGWGICNGVKQCVATGEWLYYINLDKNSHPHPFSSQEIIKKHGHS